MNIFAIFLESKSSNPTWNIIKTLVQITFFWGFFLGVLPCTIFQMEMRMNVPHFDFWARHEVACFVFIMASALGLSSGMMMAYFGSGTPLPLNTAKKLVVVGPYRYIRNPMVVAGLTQGAAVSLWLGSWFTLLYAILGIFVWDQLVRPVEEIDLVKRFGQSYEDYCQQIKCWIPNFKGYKETV